MKMGLNAALLEECPTPGYPLIGLEDCLADVHHALARLSSGTGGVVIVEGSAGAGKSRVLEHAVAAARSLGVTVAAERATGVDRAIALSTLATVLRSCAGLEPMVARLGDLEGSRLRLLEELRAELEKLLVSRRLIVVIDDFHLSDELTAIFLHMLTASLRHRPVLWLLALRPSPAKNTGTDVVELLVEDGAARIQLGGLSDDEISRLCTALLGAPAGPEVLAMAARAGGNPYLCHTLVRCLRDDGLITIRDGLAKLTEEAGRSGMPDGCARTVLDHLSDLSPAGMNLLRAGAVLGRGFTVHEAARLTGRPVAEVLAVITEVLDADVLTSNGSELAFRQDLVRDVVYGQLSEPVRMAMHREATEVVRLEGRSAAEISAHLFRSGANGVAAAAEWVLGMVRERAACSPGEVTDLALRALDLLGDRHPLRGELTVEAVRLFGLSGRWRQARELGERALQTKMDADAETMLLLGLVEVTQDAGDCGAVVEYTQRALARPALPDRFRAQLLAAQAFGQAAKGDPTSEGLAEEAVGLCGPEDQEVLTLGILARGLAARALGEFGRSLDLVQEAVTLADSSGVRMNQRHPRMWLGCLLTEMGRFDEAAAVATSLPHDVAESGSQLLSPMRRYQQARLRFSEGQLAEAQTEAEAGVVAAEKQTAALWLVQLLCLLSEIQLASGDLAGAEKGLQRSEELAELTGGTTRADIAWRRVLWQEAVGRDRDAIRSSASLYSAIGTAVFLVSGYPVVAPSMVRLALRGGDIEHARAVSWAVRELAVKNPGVVSLEAAAIHVTGLIENDPDLLASAAEAHQRGGWRMSLAASFEDAGRVEFSHGNSARAEELWAEARDVWISCGANRYAHRVNEALQRLTIPEIGDAEQANAVRQRLLTAPEIEMHRNCTESPPTPPARLANLTESELQVARLVAKGMTNKKIAAHLALSPHTVDTHVRNSFTKLDVTNRVELTIKVVVYDCENNHPAG